MTVELSSSQMNLIILILGSVMTILKGIEFYLRNQQTNATKATAEAQKATANALEQITQK